MHFSLLSIQKCRQLQILFFPFNHGISNLHFRAHSSLYHIYYRDITLQKSIFTKVIVKCDYAIDPHEACKSENEN